MSATEFSAELREYRRRKLFRQITQSLLPIHAQAHLAARYKSAFEAVRQQLQALREINLELMLSDAKRRAGYAIVLLAALAVYGIDFILLSAVAEYFARRVYSDPLMVWLARMIIPAAILTIELMIASQRAFAHEWVAEHGSSKTSRIWIVFSLLLLCFLPAMLLATHIVSIPAHATETFETVNILLMIGLVALAVVMHGVVLYGGHLAVEAKAYLYLKIRSGKLNRKKNGLENKYHTAVAAMTRAFIVHEQLVQECRWLFPDVLMTTGPFDLTTRQLLQSSIGRELPGLPSNSGTSVEQEEQLNSSAII